MIIDLIVAIGVIISIICAGKVWSDWGWGEGIGAFVIGLIFTFLGTIPIAFVIGACEWGETRPVVQERYELTAMQDNTQLSSSACGLIFVAQVRVNEKLMYTYMYKDELGIATDSVPANKSYINSTSETPYVLVMGKEYVNPVLRQWLPLVVNPEYVFYLPEDAEIADDFTIDLD